MIKLKIDRKIKTDDKELLEETFRKDIYCLGIRVYTRYFDYTNEKIKNVQKVGFNAASTTP